MWTTYQFLAIDSPYPIRALILARPQAKATSQKNRKKPKKIVAAMTTSAANVTNETAAAYLSQPREWFPGRNLFVEIPSVPTDWTEILRSVAETRNTHIDRSRRGLFFLTTGSGPSPSWSVLAFPITLHDGRPGVVLTARILERVPTLLA